MYIYEQECINSVSLSLIMKYKISKQETKMEKSRYVLLPSEVSQAMPPTKSFLSQQKNQQLLQFLHILFIFLGDRAQTLNLTPHNTTN